MDILEAIKSRRTVRAFQTKVPPRSLIETCLEAATWAPSATNQQPWEFIVASGAELQKVTDVTKRHFAARIKERPAFDQVPDHYRERQKDVFAAMNQAVGDQGVDTQEMYADSLRFFNAPYGVYFATYKTHDYQYQVSVAAAIENFLLAVVSHGLGACWQAASVICQEELKQHLGLAEDKILLAGVGVGYPVADAPLNNYRRNRATVAECTTWLGC
jgi:nitroreductase